jgi:hypothetical protein
MYLIGLYMTAYWDWCMKVTAKRPRIWQLGVFVGAVLFIALVATWPSLIWLALPLGAIGSTLSAAADKNARVKRDASERQRAILRDTQRKL